jgi:hypothetical protein
MSSVPIEKPSLMNWAAPNLWKSVENYTLTYTIAQSLQNKLFVINTKLADAADLKSAGAKALWGFDSPSRHQP